MYSVAHSSAVSPGQSNSYNNMNAAYLAKFQRPQRTQSGAGPGLSQPFFMASLYGTKRQASMAVTGATAPEMP